MKTIIRLFSIILMFIMCCDASHAQIIKLDSVKVEFEGFGTETFADVSCEAFDYSFIKTKKKKSFHEEADLSEFIALIKDFKPQATQSFDVRGEITYYYKKNPTKYCFTVFGVFYKDGQLFYNKNLLIYITDKFYTDHPQYLDTLRQQ